MDCSNTSWGELLHSYSRKVTALKETAVPLMDLTALSDLIQPLPASSKIECLVVASLVRFPQLVAELCGEFVDVADTAGDDPEEEVQAGASHPFHAVQARCQRTGRILLSIAKLCLSQGIYPAIFFSEFLKHVHGAGREVRYGSGLFLGTPGKAPCANLSPLYSKCCRKEATTSCPHCELVAYCSKECQDAHWELVHEDECGRALQDSSKRDRGMRQALRAQAEENKRTAHPSPVTLWDRIPAFGLVTGLRASGNRPSPFRILLMDTVDLNNLIETLVQADALDQLDERYAGGIQIHVQTPNLQALARNLILCYLLLRLASDELDLDAVDAVIAIWYSAELTPSQYLLLMDTIVKLLNTIPNILPCSSFPPPPSQFLPHRNILNIQDDMVELSAGYNDNVLFGIVKQITCSGSSLSVRIHGLELYKYLTQMGLSSMEPEAASRGAVLRLREDANGIDGFLLESHYSSLEKFAQSGLLLPFATLSYHHCLPNPTLVSAIDNPRAGWSAVATRREPLYGWPIHQVMDKKRFHVPRNDLYGNLYYHIRDRILLSVIKIADCNIALQFYDHNSGDELRKDLVEKGPGPRSIHIAHKDLISSGALGSQPQVRWFSALDLLYELLHEEGALVILDRFGAFAKNDMKPARSQFHKFISNFKDSSNEFASRLASLASFSDSARDRGSELFLPHDAYLKTTVKQLTKKLPAQALSWEIAHFMTFRPFMIYRRPPQPVKADARKKKAERQGEAADQNAVPKTLWHLMFPSISTPEECYKEVMLTSLDHHEVFLLVRRNSQRGLLNPTSPGDMAEDLDRMVAFIEGAKQGLRP